MQMLIKGSSQKSMNQCRGTHLDLGPFSFVKKFEFIS
jgi:hypothetical protein